MHDSELLVTMDDQDGLITRRQVLACGGDDNLIERFRRRREWATVHPGVYINHTGQLSWLQRASAALLYYWPAALSNESALHVHGLRSEARQRIHEREPKHATDGLDGRLSRSEGLIHVSVASDRRVVELRGVRLHRISDLAGVVQANRTPARVNLECSLLDVASAAPRDSEAIAVLADACQSGRTTPDRLLRLLRTRLRLPRRAFLLEVLDDVAEGAYSVLEHRYLTRVERPHGLPTAKRQRRVSPGRTSAYRDVEYVDLRTIVELDGRLGHEAALDRWDDMGRDIDSVVSGDATLRVGWKQVEDPCRTAVAVGRVLTARGWRGSLRSCSTRCLGSGDRGGSSAPGAGDPPRTDAWMSR